MNKAITDIELAWCAGLFEGEGSIFVANQKGRKYVRGTLKMTDSDVVEKFLQLVGFGKVYYQTENCKKQMPSHWKSHCYWQSNDRHELAQLMILFWPHLGKRRRDKILEIELLKLEI